MTRKQLTEQIFSKGSYLVVGLDTDLDKIPSHLRSHHDGVFEFNRQIIDATKDHCVGYKINTAFYETGGWKGWEVMQRTVDYIPSTHFKIADAKRGDIGNTSSQYARAFFETLAFDAITVAPYMGEDSIRPFLEYENKWTIVLGLTSNPGAGDFEMQRLVRRIDTLDEGVHFTRDETVFLYEKVLEEVAKWGTTENLMFVIGATRPEEFLNIRRLLPGHFLLVPGIGAQGGSIQEISKKGLIKDGGLLVNASRAVIYASGDESFAASAARASKEFAKEMHALLH